MRMCLNEAPCLESPYFLSTVSQLEMRLGIQSMSSIIQVFHFVHQWSMKWKKTVDIRYSYAPQRIQTPRCQPEDAAAQPLRELHANKSLRDGDQW